MTIRACCPKFVCGPSCDVLHQASFFSWKKKQSWTFFLSFSLVYHSYLCQLSMSRGSKARIVLTMDRFGPTNCFWWAKEKYQRGGRRIEPAALSTRGIGANHWAPVGHHWRAMIRIESEPINLGLFHQDACSNLFRSEWSSLPHLL